MSRLGLRLKFKKLEKILSRTRDEDFVQLVWSVDAAQSGRSVIAKQYLQFPIEAADPEIGSQWAIHKWELESIVAYCFAVPKALPQAHGEKEINCTVFEAIRAVINRLRDVENSAAGARLQESDIWTEMHRIGHKQFPWQSGYINSPHILRNLYVFGTDGCAAFFKEAYGISIEQFTIVSMALLGGFQSHPVMTRNSNLEELGIDKAAVELALSLLTISEKRARQISREMIGQDLRSQIHQVSYPKSWLRQYPIISFGENNERLRAPLVDLLAQRFSAGLYYDIIVKGDSNLRNVASRRFEKYCFDLISRMLPILECKESIKYWYNKNLIEGPDLLLLCEGKVDIVFECKATKLTFEAQFSDKPEIDAKHKFAELSKGIVQIWRFFSHLRQGKIDNIEHSEIAIGVVLTLDSWMMISEAILKFVISSAHELADKDVSIEVIDRKSIVISSAQELESLLSSANESEFLATLHAASSKKYFGWMLPQIRKELFGEKVNQKPYPFNQHEVMPWLKMVDHVAKKIAK